MPFRQPSLYTEVSLPGAAQGDGRIERTRERAGPEDPIALARRRRGIALREGAGRIRTGNAPQIVHSLPGLLAAIRESLAENRRQAVAAAKYGFPGLPRSGGCTARRDERT